MKSNLIIRTVSNGFIVTAENPAQFMACTSDTWVFTNAKELGEFVTEHMTPDIKVGVQHD